VIVTNNMFGDIVTDLGAALQGGLGMAASGNIHPDKVSLFEPIHGSAPKYAGKDVANPIGAILTAAMMLEYLGHVAESSLIEKAVIAPSTRTKRPTTLAARWERGRRGRRSCGGWSCNRTRPSACSSRAKARSPI